MLNISADFQIKLNKYSQPGPSDSEWISVSEVLDGIKIFRPGSTLLCRSVNNIYTKLSQYHHHQLQSTFSFTENRIDSERMKISAETWRLIKCSSKVSESIQVCEMNSDDQWNRFDWIKRETFIHDGGEWRWKELQVGIIGCVSSIDHTRI